MFDFRISHFYTFIVSVYVSLEATVYVLKLVHAVPQ